MKVKSVKILKNRIIFNPKGNIIKIIDKNNKFFFKFGELYFSEIKKKTKPKGGIYTIGIFVFYQFL